MMTNKRSHLLYNFYKMVTDFYFLLGLSSESKLQLTAFSSLLHDVTKFMLIDRFEQPRKPRAKKASGKQLPHSSDLSSLLEQIGLKTATVKKVYSTCDPLHIIKGFKLIERTLLTGRAPTMTEWNALNLGDFRKQMVLAADSLSTLLLSIRSLGQTQAKRCLVQIMTIVTIYRTFKVKAIADETTILNPYNGDTPLDTVIARDFTDERIDNFLDKFMDKSKLGDDYDSLFIYSGNASSPNGGHSSTQYLADVAAVMKDRKLLESIQGLASHFKFGKDLLGIMGALMVNIWDDEFIRGKIHSRLVTFTAPGGKARIIAVVDWLSQTALSAIHKTQYRLLRMIPSDRTHDHKSGLGLFVENAECYHSIDLSAATDRLPRQLLQRLIERTFTKLGKDGREIGRLWAAIVDRDYSTKNSLLEKVAPNMRYAVGQGMGLFSSWSSMALVHHFIVNELCGCAFANYVLVGDDLLMRDSESQYHKYVTFMSEIGVRVNLSKTLISLEAPHSVEFARNFIIDGIRISPLPIGSVFAWLDGKIGGLEVFCAFANVFDSVSVVSVLRFLKITDPLLLLDIGYFLVRDKIMSYQQVADLLTEFKVRFIITEVHIKHIVMIVANGTSAPMRAHLTKLTQALESQCTVRTEADYDKLGPLALDFSVLKFAGEEIEDYSETMHNRMNEAKLIQYDHDFAVSTVSKREHRLIKDLVITLESRDRTVRAGSKRIK